MGWTLTIGLYGERDNLPDAVAALYTRLLVRGQFQRGTVHGRYPNPSSEPTHLSFSKEQLHSLAHDILRSNSDKALELEMTYLLGSGMLLPLDFHLYGSEHRDGYKTQVEEQVSLDYEENDSFRSFRESLVEQGMPDVSYDDLQHLGEDVLATYEKQLTEDVYRSARELFFRACDLPQDEPMDTSKVGSSSKCSESEHAVLYSDNGYGSLVGCSAIFYREPSEFARDFVRIYLEYDRGIHMPIALEPEVDLGNIKPPIKDARWGMGIPGKVNPGYYPYMDHATPGTNDVIEFLEGLREEKVWEIASLSGERVRELLAEMAASNAVPEVRVDDFGDCGLLLFTQPLSSVWRAYRYIVEHSA